MPSSRKPHSALVATGGEELAGDFWDELEQAVWMPALCFALDADGAVARCPRRGCRMTGKCCMVASEGEPFSCGGGIPDEILVKAAQHVEFACMVVRHLLGTTPRRRMGGD